MEKFLLPFELNVEMCAYHNKAFSLGAVKANLKSYEKWLCNKLINSIKRTNSGEFDVFEEDPWSREEGLICIQSMHFRPYAYDKEAIDIIRFNKYMLKKGHYVTGAYNEFYITGKGPHQKYYYMHDYLIFGFDDAEGVFKSAAYLPQKGYTFFDIKYDDYCDSIVNCDVEYMGIQYRIFNKDFVAEINYEYIKAELKNYMYSRRNTENEASSDIFGIRVWQEFAKYIFEAQEDGIDIRYCKAFMEHKRVMLHRIKILSEDLNFEHLKLADTYNKNVYQLAQVVHLLCLKYNIKKDADLLKRIAKIIGDINMKEVEIINQFLEKI